MEFETIITQVTPDGFYSFTPCDPYYIDKWGVTSGFVTITDARTISPAQRMAIYALFRDIANWSGHLPEEIKELLKYDFMARTGYSHFSLSDVDKRTAYEFMQHLIEFVLMHDIPVNMQLSKLCPDIGRYMYLCLRHKKCCLCGKKTELHHYDAVGAGRNRKEICHIGYLALPLCCGHHIEIHTIGRETFCAKHHIEPVRIDAKIAQVYKLGEQKHG